MTWRLMSWGWLAIAAIIGTSACSLERPAGISELSTVTMRFLTPATVRSLVVEVSGPGISPALFANFPVGSDSVATGTLSLPAGSARRFVVSAVDTAGVTTHRADTTITLLAGENPALAMRLEPLGSTLGITVAFGGARLILPDTGTRTVLGGVSATIVAIALRANGDTVPPDSIRWGSSSPAIATVTSGVVSGVRGGNSTITASYAGAAARVAVVVVDPASTQIVDVYTGGIYSCARRANLRVLCWGSLPSGEVLATPTEVAPGVQWTSFSAGYQSLCGVTIAREAFCWGNNRFGQLGTGETPLDIGYPTPKLVAGGFAWSEVVVGHYAACGTTYPERAVYCWGGVGTVIAEEGPIAAPPSIAPVRVSGPSLRDLTAGTAIVCGVGVSDGLPYCLGDAGGLYLSGPTLMTAPEPISRTYAIGQSAGCSVAMSGNAYCFGRNGSGEMSDGRFTSESVAPTAPERVGADISWARFSRGNSLHYCGIATDGGGYCWGSNPSGQVGDGTTEVRPSPTRLPNLWLQLAPGLGQFAPGNRDHTCGLTTAREVYCWGEGAAFQLGNGSRTSSLSPIRVSIPAL